MRSLSIIACTSLALSLACHGAMAQSVHRSDPMPAAHARDASPLIPHRQAVWVRAQVSQVDLAARTLLLQTASGPIELQASDSIRRLDQVRPGDWLDVNYELALALAVVPDSGIRERTTEESTSRAPTGRPAGSGYIEETLRVDVLEVNAAEAAIRIRGALGQVGWIAVLDDDVMTQAKVGQQLMIRYRLGVMLAFRPA